jgi:hypothetical protein
VQARNFAIIFAFTRVRVSVFLSGLFVACDSRLLARQLRRHARNKPLNAERAQTAAIYARFELMLRGVIEIHFDLLPCWCSLSLYAEKRNSLFLSVYQSETVTNKLAVTESKVASNTRYFIDVVFEQIF